MSETQISPLQQQLQEFLQSLGDTLVDFTALEVDTMIVSQIHGSQFEPLEAYAALYWLGHEPQIVLEGVPDSLHDRYLRLWRRFEKRYSLCFPDRAAAQQPLPRPDRTDEIQELIRNGSFLRSLRKLSELKSALDSGDVTLPQTDMIYAQTILQLDGDVINRFHSDLLQPDNEHLRDLVLGIHNQAVETGTKHWRGLINFMVNLIQSAVS